MLAITAKGVVATKIRTLACHPYLCMLAIMLCKKVWEQCYMCMCYLYDHQLHYWWLCSQINATPSQSVCQHIYYIWVHHLQILFTYNT